MSGWLDCMAGITIGGAAIGVHYAINRVRHSRRHH